MKSSERTDASSARTAEATDGATRITGARVTTAAMIAMAPLTSAKSTRASTHGALADANLMINAQAPEYAAKSTITVSAILGAMMITEQRKTHLTQA